MNKIPITFSHEGKQYAGSLDQVHGAGSQTYHLMIDDYYCGRLRFVRSGWVFDPTPKTQSLATLANFFGDHVTGYTENV